MRRLSSQSVLHAILLVGSLFVLVTFLIYFLLSGGGLSGAHAPSKHTPLSSEESFMHVLREWAACDSENLSFAVGDTLSFLTTSAGGPLGPNITWQTTNAGETRVPTAISLGMFVQDWIDFARHVQAPSQRQPCSRFQLQHAWHFLAAPASIDTMHLTSVSLQEWDLESAPHASTQCANCIKACAATLAHTATGTRIALTFLYAATGYALFGVPQGPSLALTKRQAPQDDDASRLARGPDANTADIHIVEPFAVHKTLRLPIATPTQPLAFAAAWERSAVRLCDRDRAERFFSTFNVPDSEPFNAQARALIQGAAAALHGLGMPFWLSSGTLLGWYRQCGFIGYSKDVDFGIYASDYDPAIISAMAAQGLELSHWFGHPEDTFELSFETADGLKLDVFFFYRDGAHTWNGGTQARTGKKFKYTFDNFDLCWTVWEGIKARVPCDTERYLRANYGADWFTPVTAWDWKKSPPNVVENGVWPRELWPQYIRCRNCLHGLDGRPRG